MTTEVQTPQAPPKKIYSCHITKMTPTQIDIEFNFPTPTGMIWINRMDNKGHWIYTTWRNRFERCMKNFHLLKRNKCRKTVAIYRHSHRRIRDDVNFRQGCKPMVDIFRKMGLIVDDDEVWMKDIYEQVRSTEAESKTVVRIIDWENNHG